MMIDAFYDFEWPVAPDYEWQDWLNENGEQVIPLAQGFLSLDSPDAIELAWNRRNEAKEQSGPVLSPVVKEGEQYRRYRPMQREHAGLFRQFGELDYTSRDKMLEFAKRFGPLGVTPQSQSVTCPSADGTWREHHALGEAFLDWSVEICFMREALELSDDKGLSHEKSSRLAWLFNRQLQQVQGRISLDQPGGPRLLLSPLSLVAALWLQLALAVSGDKRFVKCKFCTKVFEISTELTGFRSHREFCSDSCKTKDYRRRKRTALQLTASGVSVQKIAEATGTERSTVRAWLATARQSRIAKS